MLFFVDVVFPFGYTHLVLSQTTTRAEQLVAEALECIRNGTPGHATWRLADALGLLAGELHDVQTLPGLGEFTGRGFRLAQRPQLRVVPADEFVVEPAGALAAECPKCGAVVGEACKKPEGGVAEVHVARERNARILGRAFAPAEARR